MYCNEKSLPRSTSGRAILEADISRFPDSRGPFLAKDKNARKLKYESGKENSSLSPVATLSIAQNYKSSECGAIKNKFIPKFFPAALTLFG
jgi:hypothetical protein